jgi:hypothetical protein
MYILYHMRYVLRMKSSAHWQQYSFRHTQKPTVSNTRKQKEHFLKRKKIIENSASSMSVMCYKKWLLSSFLSLTSTAHKKRRLIAKIQHKIQLFTISKIREWIIGSRLHNTVVRSELSSSKNAYSFMKWGSAKRIMLKL